MALRGHFFMRCFSREIEKGPGGGLSTSEEFHSVRNVELGINSSLRTPNSYLNRLLKVQNIRIIRQSAEEPPAAEYPETKLQVNGKLLDLYSENRSGTVFSVRGPRLQRPLAGQRRRGGVA